jgi:hypothetical protein
MCAGHIIDAIFMTLLACTCIATAFRDGIEFLLANVCRSNPKRERKAGRLRTGLVVVEDRT